MKAKNAQQGSGLPKLASPAQRALQSIGITELKQLTKITEAELLQLHGMGRNALGRLKQALAKRGLSFRETKKI